MSRRRRAVPERPDLLDMTSVADGRTHTITAAEVEHGIWQGTGHYRALCGATVIADAMASSPGPDCRTCRDHRNDPRHRLGARLDASPPCLFARLAHRLRS